MEKILLISPLPPPIGGIATWTKHILKSFEGEKRVELLHYNSAIAGRRITQHSFLLRVYVGIIQIMTFLPKVISFIKENDVKMIHFTSSASLGIFRDYLLLKKVNNIGVKSVIHFRFGRIPELAIKKNWEWKMICRVINRSTKVIVIDTTSYTTLVKYGFKNIEYLPNPIAKDIEEKEKSDPTIYAKRVKGRILFVGHVTPAKGVVELVKACAEIEEVKELHVIGPYEETFKAELEKIAITREHGDWLKILGSKSKEEVVDNMQNCHIFVLPSYSEGFPNVILEAMAVGCPIISTSVGAIPEMLDIYSITPAGMCVSPKNERELKIAIKNLLNNEKEAVVFGERARIKLFDNYTTDIVKEKIITIWTSTI